jgi:hypothetical protein
MEFQIQSEAAASKQSNKHPGEYRFTGVSMYFST